MLAVVDADAQVLQCKAGDRALGQHLAHAFLDGRDELARDRAADDVVDELEARAARRAARCAGTPRRTARRRRSASCAGDDRRPDADRLAVGTLGGLVLTATP